MSDERGFEVWLSEHASHILVVVLGLALLSTIGVGGYYFHSFQNQPIKIDPEPWGQFGDFFGGVLNPIFGFLSVFALLVALVIQTRELKLSRESLRISQDEQAKTSEALSLQNRAIQKQSFEQTFFAWLGTYRQVLLEIKGPDGLSGRSALKKLWQDTLSAEYVVIFDNYVGVSPLSGALAQAGIDNLKMAEPAHYSIISRGAKETWNALYLDAESELDSMFRVVYRLLKWIDHQPSTMLNEDDKWLYVGIVRSQLSWIEMVFLYFNGMTPRGAKFKPLIERYALFDNLTIESDKLLLILRECPLDSIGYAPSAYSSDVARSVGFSAQQDEPKHD